ncbi:MAG TPA: IPT/TIG domain-containing protein [Candidatus Sulfotelmatobacter sp.]|nr:IPT/TIG domain-containing protein [Candidatus Sulfotelmatobacter sp.]
MNPQKKIDSVAIAFFLRLVTALVIVVLFAALARAGGPKYVAGSTFFNSSTMGQPITWQLGQINYYTDQGDLSPILPNASANAFVASAFSQWTAVSTASLTATNAGQLAEDVSGNTIAVDSNGAVTAPADITSSATQAPVGIVYDYDGSVTDALLGTGAGAPSQCFWNAVYGGVDNFGVGANFLHALVIINGQCALQSSQLTDVEYRLVRVLGNVIGLGWSQLNINVITGRPPPTLDDRAGFPVMHQTDLSSCVPITLCYANPYQLTSDDVAALSRLYPSSASNPAARIHGTVYFVDHRGNPGQPMQGVNVFARWIDPSTGLPSHRYAASSVSGFLFTGNTGNPITGWNNPLGSPYTNYGSSDQSVEGFFDLGGLPIPNGASTAQYQLDVEALDPLWSGGVCPYTVSQVAPSGSAQPIMVTVAAGGDYDQDIVMFGSAQAIPSWAATETWSAPATVPVPGDWIGSLSGFGDVTYFSIPAQANRTLSVAVTALDETGVPTESKAAPVIGMWTLGDPPGTPPPALTPTSFNSATFGMSRLDAQVLISSSFLIGISDLRGDGRPDYHYHAHVLYGDSVSPARIPVNGGVIALKGIGLAPGLTVMIGSNAAPLLSSNAGQMLATASAQSDGPQTITINDPVSGAFSTMTSAVTFGAAATDQIVLLPGVHPPTPVGTQATNPVMVQVLASDGITPVDGATVAWTTTSGATLSACGGATSCSAVSDESGMSTTWVTPAATGTATITAALAPAAYNPPKSVSTVVSATSSTTDIGVTTPYLWIASGATLSVPLTARVVSLGSPKIGSTVNFAIMQGSASLSAPSSVTNTSGYASVSLNLTNFTGTVLVSACVAPGNNPCQTIAGNSVAANMISLQAVAGEGQVVTGLSFQPMTVRVTDLSTPPNGVLGETVLFQSTVMRPVENGSAQIPTDPSAIPAILSESETIGQSDVNGLATFVPSVGSFTGPLEVAIQVSAGAGATLQGQIEIVPAGAGGNVSQPTSIPWHGPRTPKESRWNPRNPDRRMEDQ